MPGSFRIVLDPDLHKRITVSFRSWSIVRQITLSQDLQHRVFIHCLFLEQCLCEGIEGGSAPPEDRRRPVERRIQLGVNPSCQFGITVKNCAWIAMRSIEQRMLGSKAEGALHVKGKPRGPRQIAIVGTTGTARDTFEHQFVDFRAEVSRLGA